MGQQWPGIYFLSGTDPESGEPALYIGEAETVAARIKNHAGKDFWVNVTAFVSKDENLTKAHIRYLEGKLIDIAGKKSGFVHLNSTSSGAKLPESDAAEMDIFLDKVFQLLPVLGITHFRDLVEKPSTQKEHLSALSKG
ncbi:MAG: GIY-YIG nuclease family protein [Candidatus Thiodiazotropha sp.]